MTVRLIQNRGACLILTASLRQATFAFGVILFHAPLLAQVPGGQLGISRDWTPAFDSAISLPDVPQPRLLQQPAPATSWAQTHTVPPDSEHLSAVPAHMLHDEWHIVTSPAHIRGHDLRWLLPLAGATAASLAFDSRTMRDVVTHDPGVNSASDTASSDLRDVLIAAPIAIFGLGELTHHEQVRSTGLLAGEAMAEAFASDEALKYITLRERPTQNYARGHFFSADAASDPSFVSGHAIVAWSSAAVLAGQYSKPWQQAAIYTVASGVSFTRVLAQQHFPTDVLLGSASGWLIGHYVSRFHHHQR